MKSGGRRRYPSGYPYKHTYANPDPWSQVASGGTYGYPHLLSTRGKRACWYAETNVVICTFCQPEASEPIDMQRLTLSSAPSVIQIRWVRWHAEIPKWLSVQTIFINPDPWSKVAGGDTQVVIVASLNNDWFNNNKLNSKNHGIFFSFSFLSLFHSN